MAKDDYGVVMHQTMRQNSLVGVNFV